MGNPVKPGFILIAALLAVSWQGRGQGGGRRQGGPPPVYRTDVPAHELDIVVGKLTKDSAIVSVLSYTGERGTLFYGTSPGKLEKSLPAQDFPKDQPVSLRLEGLKPGTKYTLELRRDGGKPTLTRSFTTLRAPGKELTFSTQADSHLDGGSEADIYLRSLKLAQDTDFLVDLGDTFMTDKYPNFQDSHRQYLAQRYYFDYVSAPVLFVPGNHDGERGADPEMAVWAKKERLRYFPSADDNYWACETGDALLIALNPYSFTTRRPRRGGQGSETQLSDNWYVTLGKTQYDWLKKTLEGSKARWKFVFIHNLVGGDGRDGRGGAEAAPFWEWGGKGADGKDEFAVNRPEWGQPIHSLLRKHKVTAVFHGHDHLFARQQLDGIVYQCVPQPSHRPGGGSRSAEEYGYKSGTILSGSGMLKVTVSPTAAKIAYWQTDLGAAKLVDTFEFGKEKP